MEEDIRSSLKRAIEGRSVHMAEVEAQVIEEERKSPSLSLHAFNRRVYNDINSELGWRRATSDPTGLLL